MMKRVSGAMNELMRFQRRGGESMDSVLVRFQLVRQRARQEGNYTRSVDADCIHLFRTGHVGHRDFVKLLRPLGIQFPKQNGSS